jgi:hypothetical protein
MKFPREGTQIGRILDLEGLWCLRRRGDGRTGSIVWFRISLFSLRFELLEILRFLYTVSVVRFSQTGSQFHWTCFSVVRFSRVKRKFPLGRPKYGMEHSTSGLLLPWSLSPGGLLQVRPWKCLWKCRTRQPTPPTYLPPHVLRLLVRALCRFKAMPG